MSLYKLWHKLFGWDYIYWQNSVDRGIARVHKALDGTVWYFRYKNINLIDTIPDNWTKIVWLTCHPSKYINPINIASGEDVCV